jgi:hypothetical protein
MLIFQTIYASRDALLSIPVFKSTKQYVSLAE